jgi:mono/diheme cytochrome c family protein
MLRDVIAAGLLFATMSCGEPQGPTAKQRDADIALAQISFDGADAADAASKNAHGERMSRILGCKACHGDNLQGTNVTAKEPEWGEMNAPNLTLMMAQYTDNELDAAIRRGVPRDRRPMWFMPSETFQFLSDADLSALISYLRTVEPGGEQLPPIRKGPLFHKLVEAGELFPAPQMVERFNKSQPIDLGPQHAAGRQIAKVVCAECHNSQLQGLPDFSPSLDVAGAFSTAELEELLTTGKGKSKPDLGLMTEASRHRFSKLTPHERSAVVAYLKARAEKQ